MEKLPETGDVIGDKYVVEKLLGQGGMGAVFEVSHRFTGKRFALKWLLPALTGQVDAGQRFMREAQVAGRVDHANVVQIYDVSRTPESFFIVMELLRGETLAARLDRVGKLAVSEACALMSAIAHGLSAAHSAGVIHRDLKPDNIFLCSSTSGACTPKILDFGIAKMSELPGEVATRVTRTGMIMGTPHYMSPEQVRAQPVDERTDIYALGVVLYEALSGIVPFPGDNYGDLVLRIMTHEPQALDALVPEVPAAMAKIVRRAMARDAAERFTSAAKFAEALAPFETSINRKVEPVHAVGGEEGSGSTVPRISTPFVFVSPKQLDETSRRGNSPSRSTLSRVAVVGASLCVLGIVVYSLLDHRTTGPTMALPVSTTALAPATAVEGPSSASNTLDAGLPVVKTTRIEEQGAGLAEGRRSAADINASPPLEPERAADQTETPADLGRGSATTSTGAKAQPRRQDRAPEPAEPKLRPPRNGESTAKSRVRDTAPNDTVHRVSPHVSQSENKPAMAPMEF